MRHGEAISTTAAREVLERADERRPDVTWATVKQGGSPALVVTDGEDEPIPAQTTIGPVAVDEVVRVERHESGATLIIGTGG